MKIFGTLDEHRTKDQIQSLIEAMGGALNHGSYRMDHIVKDHLGLGHLRSGLFNVEQQPIWNEDQTICIVMAGKIFDSEPLRTELAAKGHTFTYRQNDAEVILHSFEEYGREAARQFNGIFVCALYDTQTKTLTLINDRYGLKPCYYASDDSRFTFASEVKALLKDDTLKKEINWDGWRDYFSYGYLLGTKTLFKHLHSLPNASIVTVRPGAPVEIHSYWDYDEITIDYAASEPAFIEKGASLLKQAIERQTAGLKQCYVFLSGGYDSRGIASAIKYYTNTQMETWTGIHPVGLKDGMLAKKIAACLHVKNTFVPTPDDLLEKHFIEKIYLLDGLCAEHLWMLPLVQQLKQGTINFDGVTGHLFKGTKILKTHLNYIHDDEELASRLHRDLQKKGGWYGTYCNPSDLFIDTIQDHLTPRTDPILHEIRQIKPNENRITIFILQNRTRNVLTLTSNNLIATKTPCFHPLLDNDLVNFCLSISPQTKIRGIYFKILQNAYPEVMRIPSTKDPPPRYFKALKERIDKLLFLVSMEGLRPLKNVLFHFFSVIIPVLKRKRMSVLMIQPETTYLLTLLKNMRIPPVIDGNKVNEKTRDYVKKGEDPTCFLIPLVEFCIWYNLFYCNTDIKDVQAIT